MVKFRTLVAMSALAAGVAALPAGAAEDGFYVGGSLGQSDSGLRTGSANYSDTDMGYKLIAGFRAIKLLAVEVNYLDLGSTSSGGAHANTKALDVSALGFLPIPVVDIYGRVGVVSWKTDASVPSFSISHNGADLSYGVGVQMHLGAVAARLEYEGFDIQQASTPTLLTIGVTYTF